jgi:hypothetical protein
MEPNTPTTPSPNKHGVRFSFFWPVVLIAIGVVFLLNNVGLLPGNAWDWVLRIWPLIFIAWGLDALLRSEFASAVLQFGLGAIFLLSTLGYFSTNIIDLFLRLWPIFLISAGIGLLFDKRGPKGIGSLIGAVLVLLVLAGSIWLISNPAQLMPVIPGNAITQSLDGAKAARVNLEPPAGYLSVKALDDSQSLLEGTIALQGSESYTKDFTVQNGTAVLRLKGEGVYIGFGPTGSKSRNWDMRLNGGVPVDLNVNMGAGDANLDLSELNLTSAQVNMAVGSTTMVLPAAGKLNITLNGAIQSVTLIMPASTALRVHLRGGLTATTIPAGFIQDAKVYTSENYDSSANQIDVYVSQAIGALTVQRQTGR